MIAPTITIAPGQMDEIRELLHHQEKMLPRAIRRAINRTTRAVRSKMTKLGAAELGAKQKTVRGRVWQNKAKRIFYGKVRAGKFGWPIEDLYKVKTKPAAGGRQSVWARIKRRWALIEGAFPVTLTSGHEGIFQRKGRARLPIHKVRSSSLSIILEEAGLVPELVAFARERLAAEMLDAAEWYGEKAERVAAARARENE